MRAVLFIGLIVACGAAVIQIQPHHEENHFSHHETPTKYPIHPVHIMRNSEMPRKENTMKQESIDDQMNNEVDSFGNEIEHIFGNMVDVVKHARIPFFFDDIENAQEDRNNLKTNHVEDLNHTNVDQNTLLNKTREELRKDIDALKKVYADLSSEFDEWVISNKHQNFKSMVIGAVSAICVIIVYVLLGKCCRRRSRLGHLAAFANDGFSTKNGDNESLLPGTSNKFRRHPSNSDEDI
ncbi:unnamed protein product [Caenorhabditis bovis]|uniref:Uncharacterized protein n=1 Tax=Caenorhabditis bovis TaxID=2654633 RepID=A0A8S1F365_9PELO|nr:unnamed protein product [Caenorhabditis bovis]